MISRNIQDDFDNFNILICVHVFVVWLLGIHSKNLVAILHLLVTLARYYRAPIRLPENVVINVIVVQVSWSLLWDCAGMSMLHMCFSTIMKSIILTRH